ncbi:unnamed protein product, partial [Clonostachys rhizophaga]
MNEFLFLIERMLLAWRLPVNCLETEITIVGQHVSGDALSKERTIPWAAAFWLSTHDTNEYEQKLQLDGLVGLDRRDHTARLSALHADWLEQRGVQFKRVSVGPLTKLDRLGYGILINAVGPGVRTLADVKDSKVQPDRLQSAILNHSTYREGYILDRAHKNQPDVFPSTDQKKTGFVRQSKIMPCTKMPSPENFGLAYYLPGP